jgi:hypothetical protein
MTTKTPTPEPPSELEILAVELGALSRLVARIRHQEKLGIIDDMGVAWRISAVRKHAAQLARKP